jgi:hypothetical protein
MICSVGCDVSVWGSCRGLSCLNISITMILHVRVDEMEGER